MKELRRTYDVKLKLNKGQVYRLETRLQALDCLYQSIYKKIEQRTLLIHQQRTYRNGDDERKERAFHRRYVYMGGNRMYG